MSVYVELFQEFDTTVLDGGQVDGDCLLVAICALADEVRALRCVLESGSKGPVMLNVMPGCPCPVCGHSADGHTINGCGACDCKNPRLA